MSRLLRTSVWMLSTCWALTAAPLRAEEFRELKIIAAAHDSPIEAKIGPVQLRGEGGMAIRGSKELAALSGAPNSVKDAARLKELEAELAKALNVATIDWSKQMVLAVRGKPGTKLDRIQIDFLMVHDKILNVAWKVNQRPPHAGPGTPAALILVDRFDAEVKFVEVGR